jgi:hypothetical protein
MALARNGGHNGEHSMNGAALPARTGRAFSVEEHGVDLIPDAERHGRPVGIFLAGRTAP